MARNKDVSLIVRNLMISHWENGKSVRCMRQILKLSKSTDFNINQIQENSVENEQSSKCPRTFNESEKRWILSLH